MEQKNEDEITLEQLEQAAMPLVELLRKKGHPLMVVQVTSRSVDIYKAIKGMPFPYED